MDQHLADDVVWHVGGNSKWAEAYQGKANVLGAFRPSGPVNGRAAVDAFRFAAFRVLRSVWAMSTRTRRSAAEGHSR